MYRSQLTGNSDLSISDMSYLLSLENSTGENDLSVITDRQDDQDFSIPALLSNVSQQSDDLVLIQSRYLKGDESSLYKKKNLELLSSVHYFPTPGVLIPSRRKDTSYVHLYGHSIKIKDSSNKTFYMCNFGGSHGCHKHYESKDSNTSAIRRHLEDVHGFTKTTGNELFKFAYYIILTLIFSCFNSSIYNIINCFILVPYSKACRQIYFPGETHQFYNPSKIAV